MYEKPEDVKEYGWPYNLLQALEIETDDPLDHMSDESTMELVMCISRLNEREKRVLRLRFYQQKTLREVGQEIGTQPERARQIEAKAIRKLRHYNDTRYILRHGAKAYVEKRIEEQVKALLEVREAELEAEYEKKRQELELGKDVVEYQERHNNRMLKSLEDLDLSVRAFNSLHRAGCSTVGDVITMYPTYDEACRIRNFGRLSMKEVTDRFQEMGLKWPKEDG